MSVLRSIWESWVCCTLKLLVQREKQQQQKKKPVWKFDSRWPETTADNVLLVFLTLEPKHGLVMQLFHLRFGSLQGHFLCFLCEFLFFRDSIQAGRAGLRAGASSSSSNPARSSSGSGSSTESSFSPESSSGSDKSGSNSGGIMVTTSSEKRTRRFSSTRLWVSRIKRMKR